MLAVKSAEYVGGYQIRLSFNNGKTGIANLEETLMNDKRPIFLKLQNQDIFKRFKLAHSTLVWDDEIDLAPEFLFFVAFMNDAELQEQFKAWGYL